MKSGNFFAELRRRNVYKVAVAYAVVPWLLIQIATRVCPIFEIRTWWVRLVVRAMIAGFPIALIIAWAFELNPDGIDQALPRLPCNPHRLKVVVWHKIAG